MSTTFSTEVIEAVNDADERRLEAAARRDLIRRIGTEGFRSLVNESYPLDDTKAARLDLGL